jgi:hypothetical protein
MNKIAKILQTAGYLTINVNYYSTKYQVKKLTEEVITKAFAACPKEAKVSVDSSKVAGMVDHIELPVTPAFMMTNETVIPIECFKTKAN